jgi:hypothetical protein
MERIKQAVKKRQRDILSVERTKMCINIYEKVINDLCFRIEEGLLDDVIGEKKLYFSTEILGDFGKILTDDYSLHEFFLHKGLPVIEVGYNEISYADEILTTQFYIIFNMSKIWTLGDE